MGFFTNYENVKLDQNQSTTQTCPLPIALDISSFLINRVLMVTVINRFSSRLTGRRCAGTDSLVRVPRALRSTL